MIFKLTKANIVNLGVDSFIVNANMKSSKKEAHNINKKANQTKSTELLKLEKFNSTKTDESRKKIKSKKNNRMHYPTQQSETNTAKKSTKMYDKTPMSDRKNEKKPLIDSIRGYVDRNWKKAVAMVSVNIIFLGAIIGTPILVHHFRANHRNRIEQFKEGLIVNHFLQYTVISL